MAFRLPDGTIVEIVRQPSGNRSVRVVESRPGLLIEPPAPEARVGDTAWYVPYTGVHPLTVAGAPADAVWVDVSASRVAYAGLLTALWEAGETFALLEHDVVCPDDAVRSFEECPEPWCSYWYSDICCDGCREAWRNQLGCTRFRADLIAAVPDAVSSIPPGGLLEWTNLCDGVGNNLRAAGFTHHWHGAAEHHHMIQTIAEAVA